jgi:hypothetical protein
MATNGIGISLEEKFRMLDGRRISSRLTVGLLRPMHARAVRSKILCFQGSTDPVPPFELASDRSCSEVAGMAMEVPEENPAREKREMDGSCIRH